MAPTEPVRVRARRGDFREDAMPFSAFVVTGPGLDAKAKQLARASVLPVVTRLNDADAPELAGFAPTLKLTETGIHRPKIVECVDAAGVGGPAWLVPGFALSFERTPRACRR